MDKYIRLSDTSEWDVTFDDQDIRGREVRDAAGTRLGRVDDLLINTHTEEVEEIILDDGTRQRAEDLRIGDDAVYVEGFVESGREAGRAAAASKYERLRPIRAEHRPPQGIVHDAQREDYHQHYMATYADSGITFEEMQPVYNFGAEHARHPKYAGRGYTDVESDFRALYEARYAENAAYRPYEEIDQAIRYGFENLGRTGRRHQQPGPDLTGTGRQGTA